MFNDPDNGWNMKRGKVTDVVCKKDARESLWFKFYDCEKYRIPPQKEDQYGYVLCTTFMTLAARKSIIQWEGCKEFNGKALIGRRVIKDFGLFYKGQVTGYDPKLKLYRIVYEDDDSEEVGEEEVMKILRP